MYVILTSRPGEFRTEVTEGLRPVESCDYLFFGRCKARFVIAQVQSDCRITVIDESPPQVINRVPIKFLPKFETLELARAALRDLVRDGDPDVQLVAP